jgi:hypothetical protein
MLTFRGRSDSAEEILKKSKSVSIKASDILSKTLLFDIQTSRNHIIPILSAGQLQKETCVLKVLSHR